MVTLLLLLGCGPDAKPDGSGGDVDTAVADAGDTGAAGDDTADSGDSGETGETGEPAPADDDGDGYVSEADGGDDCEDASAHVHPGAPEYCDAVDQDCDGQALAPGVCGGVVDPAASASPILQTAPDEYGSVGMVGDLTGDGLRDLAFYQMPRDFAAVIEGGAVPPTALLVPEDAWHVAWVDVSAQLPQVVDVGDVDGDGNADLGVLSQGGTPGIYLRFGPLPAGDGEMYADADAAWWGTNPDNYAVNVTSGRDFDGDGRDDALVSRGGDSGTPAVDVFFGGEWEDSCTLGSSGAAGLHPLDDIDGDGLPDAAVNDGDSHVVSGADLRGGCGAEPSDLAIVSLDTSSDGAVVLSLGDLTGDGVPELVSTSDYADEVYTNAGKVSFFSGAARGWLDADDVLGSYVGSAERDLLKAWGTLDFDGDGRRELFIRSSERDAMGVLPVTEVPELLSPVPERALWMSMDIDWQDPGVAYPDGEVGDFDADGFDDVFIRWNDLPDGAAARVGLINGFPVPWDDAIYW